MKLIVGLFLALAVVASADVLDLTEDNFEAEIAKNKLTLVEFFAPWCGHCKSLAPEYKKAAKELEGKNAGALAAVDCTVEKELCNKYEVRGFPTIKLFRDDGAAPVDYDQARKAEAIVKFMVKQNQPAIKELSGSDIDTFQADEAVRVIAFVNAGDDVSAYTKTAQALRNEYSFGLVTADSSAASKYGVSAPGVAVLRNFDDGNVVYSGEFGGSDFQASLTNFIKAQAFPLVGEIGPENYQKYLERGFNFVWLFINLEDDTQKAIITDVVTPVAAKNRDKLSFVKLDGVRWAEHAKSFGLTGSTPGFVIEDRQKNKNFVFPENETPNTASFEKFINGYLDGTLSPTVKSEAIPEKNDGPVKVIVGHTFDELVINNDKNVLVEFYAPWCGHCKSLAPKYDELGKMFENDANVVIAKVDSTANDTPVDVQGFPTIKLFLAGQKDKPVEYNGDRTAEKMAEFIREHVGGGAGSGSAAGHSDEL